MIHKYKKIYQTEDETVSENCVEWIGFIYSTPTGCSGSANFEFSYVDCAGVSQTTIINVPCSPPIDGFEIVIPFCVRDGSVVQINGASVQSVLYGTPC